jgi:hypothetical protein
VTSGELAYRAGGFALRYVASPLSHAVVLAGVLHLTFGDASRVVDGAVALVVVAHLLVFGRTLEDWAASGRRMAAILTEFTERDSFQTQENDDDNV